MKMCMCKVNDKADEVTIRPSDKWFMNFHLGRLMRMRIRSYRRWKWTKDDNDYAKYKQVHNRVVMEVRKAKQEIENKIDFDLSQANGSKRWWNLCKEIIGWNKGNLEASFIDKGHLVTDGKDIADLLNKFFVSQTVRDTTLSSLPKYIEPVVKISQLIRQPEDVWSDDLSWCVQGHGAWWYR